MLKIIVSLLALSFSNTGFGEWGVYKLKVEDEYGLTYEVKEDDVWDNGKDGFVKYYHVNFTLDNLEIKIMDTKFKGTVIKVNDLEISNKSLRNIILTRKYIALELYFKAKKRVELDYKKIIIDKLENK